MAQGRRKVPRLEVGGILELSSTEDEGGPHGFDTAHDHARWSFDDSPYCTDYIEAYWDKQLDCLVIHTGDRQISIRPHVSNVVRVYLEER